MTDFQLLVPDLGDDGKAEVIEILFSEGDSIIAEEIIVVLESDKATMEIPCEQSGQLKKLIVKLGDEVASGDVLALLSVEGESSKQESDEKVSVTSSASVEIDKPKEEESKPTQKTSSEPRLVTEIVPDVGEGGAELIEILCKPGQEVNKDDILFVLESDKATMEIPASFTGEIKQVLANLGDKLSMGDALAEILTSESETNSSSASKDVPNASRQSENTKQEPESVVKKANPNASASVNVFRNPNVHAGPAARRLARELGVDLSLVKPSGPKERVLKDDIKAYVKANLNKGGSSANPMFDFELPEIDFAKFGDIEKQKLSRINKVSAKNLSRSWLTIPHVTQFDEADITELEAFRKQSTQALKDEGIKLTPLAFLVKASAFALGAFPRFNASLEKSGEHLILKKYINIGVAIDTEDGLVVPVIKNANTKSIKSIAKELAGISEKARNKKLMPQDMQGACFSISSLGGIGGTAFTPIVNWPEVAILGVSRSQMKPVYDGKEFVPRLMLPLSLSYDHRVIDGAEAARFTVFFANLLKSGDLLTLDE